jgi:hypothetical protein
MTDETQSKGKAIITLAGELIDQIELSQLSAESLLLKAIRLARLADAPKEHQWLAFELGGYPSNDPVALEYMGLMGRWTNFDKKIGYRMPLAQIEANISAIKIQMQTLRAPDVSYSPSNPENWATADWMTLKAPVDSVIQKGAELSGLIGQLSGIRSRVLAYVHSLVVSVYHEKIFSGLAESIFERYQSRIDILLAQRAGDILEKIPVIYNRLAEGDQEAISHAQTSCRRMIEVFADAVYPPTDKTIEVDGKPVALNAANPRARINEYIKGQTSSKSRRTKLQQTLANIFNRVSTGVHNDVTLEEAQSLFLQTYLFLGEVLTLGEPPERTTVQVNSSSPDMISASSA